MLGLFFAAALARTAAQFHTTPDDHEDWPCDADESPRQNIHLREQEIQPEKDDEDRDDLMVHAAAMVAGLALHWFTVPTALFSVIIHG